MEDFYTFMNTDGYITVGPMSVKYSTMEKDLGVEVDSQLSFSAHISNKTKKANMMAGWIRRSFQFLN